MTVQYPLFFKQHFRGRVLFNVPMSEYTTFGIGGPADVMAFPRDEEDLREILSFARAKRFAVYVLGMGSNILVRDGGIRGVVINMTEGFSDIDWRGEGNVVAGAGVSLSGLASGAAERGLSGLEFACGIPGSLGGAVRMNAGAWGGEMKDVVEGVEVLDRKGRRGFIPAADLGLTYRGCSLPEGAVVTRVHMRLTVSTPEEVRARMDELTKRRSMGGPSAGSVFKNPEGAPAGKLIEGAGFKGRREGGAMVSERHANYIINTGGARASDVLALMARIRDGVFRKSGIVLEPEIKVIGED